MKMIICSLVPRRSRLGQSWTLPWAVTSPRDTRRERLANTARSNMAAFCQVTATSAESSWKSVIWTGRVSMCMPQRKTKFRFLKKGSAKPRFVQLKWTFTRSNRYQWISGRWRSRGYGLSSKEETRQTCILSTYASFRHFWAFSSTR